MQTAHLAAFVVVVASIGLAGPLAVPASAGPVGDACRLAFSGAACERLDLVQCDERDYASACSGMDPLRFLDLSSGERRILASDGGSFDRFSYWGVAVSGDRILVAAPYNDEAGANAGAAYLFVRDGDGGYTETKIMASDARPGDLFSLSGVAISGDRLLIAAPANDEAGENAGAAYLYEPDGQGGYAETKIMASDAQPHDYFSYSGVAIEGDRILVASPYNDEAGANAGAAYLFEPDGDGGYVETKILASDARPGDLFSYFGIAMSDGNLLIAAPGHDEAGADAGAAYLYRPDDAGGLVEMKIVASDARPGDAFSFLGVAMSGDRFLVAAPYNDEAGTDAGAAYLYEPDGAGGHVEKKILASDARPGDLFSYRGVAMSGDRFLISAPGNDQAGADAGAVYLYAPGIVGGHSQTKIRASDARAGALFGYYGIAMGGDTFVVAAPLDDEVGTDAGAVYVYDTTKLFFGKR